MGCPLLKVDSSAWVFIRAAARAEKHCWPILGGWLEQTQVAMDGIELVWSEQERHRDR